jgi:hypothetical protein
MLIRSIGKGRCEAGSTLLSAIAAAWRTLVNRPWPISCPGHSTSTVPSARATRQSLIPPLRRRYQNEARLISERSPWYNRPG